MTVIFRLLFSVYGGRERERHDRLSNSRRVPEFADGFMPTRSCLDQGL